MKKRLLAALAALLLLAGCSSPSPAEEGALHILCTTYPVYLFTTAVTEGVEGVEVSLLVNSQTSCLHDYTLTVNDMKAIEGADVIVMNGAGLEEFLTDALSHSDAKIIDCSAGVELLEPFEEEGHTHSHGGEEYDPHIWMDPDNAMAMVRNIATGLADLLPAGREEFDTNRQAALDVLKSLGPLPLTDAFSPLRDYDAFKGLPLITFHDGFQYFANFYGLDLLKAIEEEEGATVSASELREIVELVREYNIPAIFIERNGSAATAEAIAAETGCEVYELDMIMSGDGTGIQPYITAMSKNLTVILEALAG